MYVQPHRRHGFSMVELLVVCAILVTLMAVILPAFGEARQRAKLAYCQSNLHEMGLATQNYMADAFGAFTPFGQIEATYTRDILVCPNDATPFELRGKFTESGTDLPISYGNNREMLVFHLPQSRVERPAYTCVYFDGEPDYYDNRANTHSKTLHKVNMIHIPPGNAENPFNISIDDDAVKAHLDHGCFLGQLDTNGIDVGAGSAATFTPRHPVDHGLGNVLFADWHIEFAPQLQEGNFLFPGGGGFPTASSGNGNGNGNGNGHGHP
ncbi:MAG: prepilin-type N-terminal cleavage/methylation domain-containing protein [Phycisphaera sp.]|nr:prepilin-type N-terminal cleavage/methylation domain-containing protein [Phycisphaera sp.]